MRRRTVGLLVAAVVLVAGVVLFLATGTTLPPTGEEGVGAFTDFPLRLFELLTDAPHWANEVIVDLIVNGLIITLLWGKVFKPRLERVRQETIAAEHEKHGIGHEEHAEEVPCGIEWSRQVYCIRPYGHPGEHYYANGELEHSWRHGTRASQ